MVITKKLAVITLSYILDVWHFIMVITSLIWFRNIIGILDVCHFIMVITLTIIAFVANMILDVCHFFRVITSLSLVLVLLRCMSYLCGSNHGIVDLMLFLHLRYMSVLCNNKKEPNCLIFD